MKNVFIVFLSFIVLVSCQSGADKETHPTKKINSNWQFSEAEKDQWLPAEVPGTVHTDLMANGKIEDPYYRLNEKDQQWIDKKDWEYKTEFDVSEDLIGKDHVEIIFHGLDTYADVFLNDQLILSADNMFRTWKVDCKSYLVKGENTIRILLKSPISIGLTKLEKLAYQLPADNDQSENGELEGKRVSIFTRKAGYHFGWDWGPRLVTSGIWRNIELEAWNEAKIETIQVVQKTLSESSAKLQAVFEIRSDKTQEISIRVKSDGKEIASELISLVADTKLYSINFDIANPELWWPNGLGKQKMYDLDFILSLDGKTLDKENTSIGLRTINLVQEPDADGNGKSFYFEVNGRAVFAKGANYIPNDVFLPRVSPEKYEYIVKSAADANMNMLRVWGGGVYENDLFYDLCDKYGILVWQDFMFACAMYPGDDAFLENVRQEAIDNVKRIRNHASLALWCGNNEIEYAWAEYEKGRGWGWKERHTPEQRKEIWHAYDTLFHSILPEVVKAYDSSTDYWHSSPSAGMGQLAGYDTRSGDMHYWGVWHGQHPFSDFKVYKARFMSEYGFQSFPEFASIEKYTLPEDWDIESEVMASHQRSGIGNLRIRQYMEDDYVIPKDFEQLLYVGQVLQAEGIKSAIEAHRSDMPYCMGSLYWQLNDVWPVASWSGIDYYGKWKALHYFVKEAYKNTIVIIDKAEKGGNIQFRIVSDLPEKSKGNLKIQLMDFNGNNLGEKEVKVEIPANDSKKVFEIPARDLLKRADKKAVVLVATLESDQKKIDRALFYFAKPKNLKLPGVNISMDIIEENGVMKVILESDKLAKNVFLVNDNCRFSDNFFDVLPGEKLEVNVETSLTAEELQQQIKVIHLQETMK